MPGSELAVFGSWHLSRLHSEEGLAKTNERARTLFIPCRRGLSYKDRCMHTCEVMGGHRGRQPAPLPKPHLEFPSLLDSKPAGWRGKNGT